jgi:ribose transport system ATP-binding protein
MVGDSSLESRGTEWDVSGNARSLSCWAPPERRRQATGDGPVIEVDGLCAEALDGCSFTAASGEVVGFAGLRESGVESLPRVLAGEVAWTGGTLRIAGHEASRHGGPRQLIDLGMTTVPADRLRAGGVAALTISENIALPALRRYWHRAKDLARAAQDVIGTFDVRPPRPAAIFGGLSGGNQQKVLLGKWLMLQPRVLVLADPTYGVDPAAREAIFDAIRGAASAGVTVLFFSTEPEQLVRLCDRVLVMNQGRISTELSGSGMHLESIVEWSEK